ncbi:hypothetical protein ACFL6T_01910 [Candidatus Zixiibacteriota bacterium]
MFNNDPTGSISIRTILPIIAFILLLAPSPADAQAVPEAGIALTFGFPSGEFKEHVNMGFGLDITGGVQLPRSPVFLGAELGFLIYGRESRREPFSTTIPDVEVRVITTNNIFNGHLFLRLQPGVGSIRPYFGAWLGFKYLFTMTEIRNVWDSDDEPIAHSTNLGDIAFSRGAGCGVAINLWEESWDSEDSVGRPVGLQLDIGLRYLLGSEADYLKRGSIERVDGNIRFDIERSRTDIIQLMIGLRATFR